MVPHTYFGKILEVSADLLVSLETEMEKRTGKKGVFGKLMEANEAHIADTLRSIQCATRELQDVRKALRSAILEDEKELVQYVAGLPGETDFDRAAAFAKKISRARKGFFLKREFAEAILGKRPPANLLKFLGYETVDELFSKHDVLEAFSALRFMESDEWMHATFDEAYSAFTTGDFEERDIEIKVLGSEWKEVAKKFVEKKHHNVSHLKEFGVIFINPIAEDVPGKFLRDSALLLHYVHEIEFYSKLFRRHASAGDFAEKFKAFLRGDVKETATVGAGEWLIVQRYLFKENPKDPRLYLPRVNPESMHWARGERDIANFKDAGYDLAVWSDRDWVGAFFPSAEDPHAEFVSLDMEDNAMATVAFDEGKNQFFNYHHREALWTKIFEEYAGGEDGMEQFLLENFEKGIIKW